MKEEEYVIFMFPKNDFKKIEETIDKLLETEIQNNFQFRFFAKRFKEQLQRDDEKTYTLEETALIVGKSERTVHRYIKSGKLRAYRAHNEWQIPEDGLTEFALKKRPGYFFPKCG